MAKLELEASPWFPHLGYTSGRRLAAKVFKLKEEIHGNEHAQDAPTRDAPSSWDCLDPVSCSAPSTGRTLTEPPSGL
jgi:hypothetical protein